MSGSNTSTRPRLKKHIKRQGKGKKRTVWATSPCASGSIDWSHDDISFDVGVSRRARRLKFLEP